jgi:hypothetical protein
MAISLATSHGLVQTCLRASCESQDPADHFDSALRARLDSFGKVAVPWLLQPILQQIGAHQDRQQHIVQIVRYTSRQSPDFFHALHPQHLRFKFLSLRHIGVMDKTDMTTAPITLL